MTPCCAPRASPPEERSAWLTPGWVAASTSPAPCWANQQATHWICEDWPRDPDHPACYASRPDGLRHASVIVLDDDPATWPARLLLRGFTYESMEHDRSVSVSTRLGWLEKDAEGYIPQPYEQLSLRLSPGRPGRSRQESRACKNGGASARCSTRPRRYGTGCYA